MLAVLLVQIILQLLETESVTLFKCTVSPILHLQTLVGEMDEVIFVRQIILSAACAHIAVLVYIDSEVVSHRSPNS